MQCIALALLEEYAEGEVRKHFEQFKAHTCNVAKPNCKTILLHAARRKTESSANGVSDYTTYLFTRIVSSCVIHEPALVVLPLIIHCGPDTLKKMHWKLHMHGVHLSIV